MGVRAFVRSRAEWGAPNLKPLGRLSLFTTLGTWQIVAHQRAEHVQSHLELHDREGCVPICYEKGDPHTRTLSDKHAISLSWHRL